jgi:hypothetical protein
MLITQYVLADIQGQQEVTTITYAATQQHNANCAILHFGNLQAPVAMHNCTRFVVSRLDLPPAGAVYLNLRSLSLQAIVTAEHS